MKAKIEKANIFNLTIADTVFNNMELKSEWNGLAEYRNEKHGTVIICKTPRILPGNMDGILGIIEEGHIISPSGDILSLLLSLRSENDLDIKGIADRLKKYRVEHDFHDEHDVADFADIVSDLDKLIDKD